MGLASSVEARSVFFALPFSVRDKLRGYRETVLLLEDRFNIKIKHGDHTTDAVGILDRTMALMRSCRVRLFDVTHLTPNVMFEFGLAKGADLQNLYLVRGRKSPLATMISNIDCPEYRNADQLEQALARALSRHYWPSDHAFTEQDMDWLATQIRELTYPNCETDKLELAAATGIHEAFITHAVRNIFVPAGDATAITVGPVPRYQFDYQSVRPVPGPAARRMG